MKSNPTRINSLPAPDENARSSSSTSEAPDKPLSYQASDAIDPIRTRLIVTMQAAMQAPARQQQGSQVGRLNQYEDVVEHFGR